MQDNSNDQERFSDNLAYVSFALELIAFVITAFNLIALYGNLVTTIRFAPQEIRDAFGYLRQQIGEESLALQHQPSEVWRKMRYRRKVAKAERKRRAGAAVTVENRGPALRAEPPPPLQSGDGALSLDSVLLGDLWVRFRRLEKQFLVPQDGNHAENEFSELNVPKKSEHENDEEYSFSQHVRFPATGCVTKFELADLSGMYRCDFVHRFKWWRVKDEVKNLGNMVTKLMLRRMERQVTQMRLMQLQMRQDDINDNWLNGEWDLADSKMAFAPGASQMNFDREGV